MNIRNYNDFTEALLKAGFSMGGGNADGIFAVVPFSWNEAPPYDTPVSWHCGDPDIDPWEWRIRILDERNDIAYAKLFFNKGGYITREWYPYFLAARRGSADFEEAYSNGTVSVHAKRIYDIISGCDSIALHLLKQQAGFVAEEKAKFERALTELQMKLYITMCGRQQKMSQSGQEYGWASTVFCTTEKFWGDGVFSQAAVISEPEAAAIITEQALKLNPSASRKRIVKFIKG